MNIITILLIIIGVLFLAMIIVGIIAIPDWRAIFVRKYGPDIRKGLAHVLEDNVWRYRASTLVFQGDDAISYTRAVKQGKQTIWVEDIVPHRDKNGNPIPIDFDEYTGERLYRVQPGGVIGLPDRGDAPAVDYPQELISIHVLDRTISNYAASVSADDKPNYAPWVIAIVLVIIAVIITLFATGTIKLPGAQSTPPANIEQTTPATDNVTDSGDITGPVITEVN